MQCKSVQYKARKEEGRREGGKEGRREGGKERGREISVTSIRAGRSPCKHAYSVADVAHERDLDPHGRELQLKRLGSRVRVRHLCSYAEKYRDGDQIHAHSGWTGSYLEFTS